MVQTRYRRVALAALALSFVVIGGVSGTAFAVPDERGSGRDEAPGQLKKADTPAAAAAVPASEADAPHDNGVAATNDEEFTGGRTEEESPADQGCDGTHGSDTGNGANTDGSGNSYHNTCDGSPSQNGGGSGEANGLPCAGCVGNADDKNPPGQYKDGGDANSGYECDAKGAPNGGNMGVGVGNPAHTGCEPGPDRPEPCPDGKMPDEDGNCAKPTCPDGTEMPPSGTCPGPKTCPDGSDMPASGDCSPSGCPVGQVCGEVRSCPVGSPLPTGGACETPVSKPTTTPAVDAGTGAAVQATVFGRPAEVLGVQVSRAQPAALGRTGTDAMSLLQSGLALTVLGLGLVLGSRARRVRVTP